MADDDSCRIITRMGFAISGRALLVLPRFEWRMGTCGYTIPRLCNKLRLQNESNIDILDS
jgi:hypothetical protein